MKTVQDVEIGQAVQAYALANTPLYLIRKLREDATVQELSRRFSGDEILLALEETLLQDPRTLEDHTRPYVYLAALSLAQRDAWLRDAGKLPNIDKWEWYRYVHSVLMETFTTTRILTIDATPKPTVLNSLAVESSATTKREFIIVNKPSEPR